MSEPIVDLPVLSGYAPWFWAMLYAGKSFENRSENFPRRFRGRIVTGDIWLHASLGPKAKTDWHLELHSMLHTWQRAVGGPEQLRQAVETLRTGGSSRGPTMGELPLRMGPDVLLRSVSSEVERVRGHIIGRIEVVRYVEPQEDVSSAWRFPWSVALEVRNPRPLATPVPAKGSISWWAPDADTQVALRRQLEAA